MAVVGKFEILNKKIQRLVRENLNQNETVLFCLVGNFSQSLIALDERILVIKSGFMAGATFGSRVTSLHYKDITGIEVNTGLLTGVIEISTPSYQGTREKDWWAMARDRDPMKVSNCIPIEKNKLKEYQPYLEKLRQKIRDAKNTVNLNSHDDGKSIGSELEKLVSLYSSGMLSNEEFEQAKKKLLS
ncbi:MAG: SHOCT domain-containing protein [Candidatus Zapsychrus exili]|nr:SHOCT domain-containing protein [Candidatus Zapsychrus exili]